ncbi:Uncharacterised protein [uncultured archaeon]|nr:Uncharacterised protein [uncultured archaeon]
MEHGELEKEVTKAVSKLNSIRTSRDATRREDEQRKMDVLGAEGALDVLRMERNEARKSLEKMQKEIEDALEDFDAKRDELEKPHDEVVRAAGRRANIIECFDSDERRMLDHIKVLGLQRDGWIIVEVFTSTLTGHHGYHNRGLKLGDHHRNNYRPDGWTIIDIVAKVGGIYAKTDKSEKYTKVSEPGREKVVMAKRSEVIITPATYGDRMRVTLMGKPAEIEPSR